MIPIVLALLVAALPDLRVRPLPPPAFALDPHALTEKRSTQTALIASAAVLLALELLIVHERNSGRVEPTISQVMEDWGQRYRTIPYMMGVLGGHWFGPLDPPGDREARRNAVILASLSALTLAWDVADHRRGSAAKPIIALGVGVAAGIAFWR